MIVMKFGGASLASPLSMKRVVSIVRSQLARAPPGRCFGFGGHNGSPARNLVLLLPKPFL